MDKEIKEIEEVWRTAQYLKSDGTMIVFEKYEVSNRGRVRSLDFRKSVNKGTTELRTLHIGLHGYYQIGLRLDNKRVWCSVHRLVASTFLEIPEDHKLLECINHKDENKLNNNVENLEWCMIKYNDNYGTAIERNTKARINHPKFSKPVLQIDPETNSIIAEYPSTHEAERTLGIPKHHIAAAISANCKTGGFYWRYK